MLICTVSIHMRFVMPGVIAVLCLTSAACTFTVGENHFFYPGPASTAPPHLIAGATVDDVSLQAADGTPLGGVQIRRPNADVEVLYFGGNAARADDMVAALTTFLGDQRANVTMIDYRGYGRSAGTPTIDAMKSDALVSFDSLLAQAGDRPIVVHGVSLGGFVAAYVAANRAPAGLILEATAPDVTTWARNQIPTYAKPIVRVKIAPALQIQSNVDALKQYSGPLLLIAGSRDAITPPRFMETLLTASPSHNKRMVIANGADHGFALNVRESRDAYAQFLDAIRHASFSSKDDGGN